ncbi:MAG: hypothetical protein ACI3Y0_12405 [Prevotella sp.]
MTQVDKITNAYFEGRLEDSKLCQYGQFKEKRNDCKIVVLIAVVNTRDSPVRTTIIFKWLTDNGFYYITVLSAGDRKLEVTSQNIEENTDNKGHQEQERSLNPSLMAHNFFSAFLGALKPVNLLCFKQSVPVE